MNVLFAFGVGPVELGVVALIILLLFGNRLPALMRSLGRGVIEFKRGVQGIEEDAAPTDPPKATKGNPS